MTDQPEREAADLETVPVDVQLKMDALCDRFEAAVRAGQHPEKLDFLGEIAETWRPLLERWLDSLNSKYNDSATSSRVIGPYRLLQQIGHGGMGEVWVAEQQHPVRRRSALKLIRSESPTKEIIARFEAERQALAMMDHPNIAKVLDVGQTENDQPYFVMDLVLGVPITDYCDRNKLSPRERLELFVTVCQAVQHAHQKGVIHRDIKPQNVLVGLYDGKPVAKVIDFGLAKALQTQTRLTEKTLFTEFGRVVGTLRYMSPEQAGTDALDIDTRTDIYSLGVMLYELLTGFTPLDQETIKQKPLLDVLQIIREKEPQVPSARLSTLTAEAASTVASLRRIEPRRLSQSLRGDLDWIVMKCLEKDRSRRYDTASALAADIAHYLADEPISVAAPSRFYRMLKFVRRNRRLVLSASVAFLALIAGGTAATIGLIREAKQLARAEERETMAIDAVNRFQDAVTNEPMLMNSPELVDLRSRLLSEPLDFFRKLKSQLQASRSTRPESLLRLAEAATALAGLSYEIGDKQDSLSAYQESREIWERLTQLRPGEFQAQLAANHCSIGRLFRESGKFDEALAEFERSRAILQQLTQTSPAAPQLQSDLAVYENEIGLTLSSQGQLDDALEHLNHARVIQQRLAENDTSNSEHQAKLAAILNNIGTLLSQSGKPSDAVVVHQDALAIQEQLTRREPAVIRFQRERAANLSNLGLLFNVMRKPDDALAAFRQALEVQERLAREHPTGTQFQWDLAISHSNVGQTLHGLREWQEAITAYEQAAGIYQRLVQNHAGSIRFQSELAGTKLNLGNLLDEIGKSAEAEAMYQEAVDIQEHLVRENSAVPEFEHELALIHYNIGRQLQFTGRPEEAVRAYEKAQAIWERLVETQTPSANASSMLAANSASMLGATLNNLAVLDVNAERFVIALPRVKQAIFWQNKALEFDAKNPSYRQSLLNHYTLLSLLAENLNDPELSVEAQRGLQGLQDTGRQ